MKRLPLKRTLVTVLTLACAFAADRVSTKDGNIILEDSDGHITTLTQTGRDFDPWISPGGRTVVFLRQSPEDMFQTSVYQIDMLTRMPELLYAGPAKYRGRESRYFGRPELNQSHDTLFLISHEYATSGALLAIRLPGGQTTWVSDHVVGYDVIQCPKKYRGHLIALLRHEENLLGRPFFMYHLYSSAGKELGLAGSGELDEEMDFLRDGPCDEPEPEPQPSPEPSASISPLFRNAIRIDDHVMERRLLKRVDPVYPPQPQSEHIQGDIRLVVRVSADGSVESVELISGPPTLVESAMNAVKQWKYQPAISSGHPVAVFTIVKISFRLPPSDN